MIVSHAHKFIFIKTHKVAGTSIEFVLTRYAGADGIVTPIQIRQDEIDRQAQGFGGPRNYVVNGKTLAAHSPASALRDSIGDDVFGRYFKFSIERNPFDKVASLYWWMNRDPERRRFASFEEFIESSKLDLVRDWPRYTIDGKIVMDLMILYERLEDGFRDLSVRLGLPALAEIGSIRRKSGHRPDTDYRALYTRKTRRIVEQSFAREIDTFGFTFEPAG